MTLQKNEQSRSWMPEPLRRIYHRLIGKTESAFTGLKSEPDAPAEPKELIQENAYFRDFSEVFTFISSQVEENDSRTIRDTDNKFLFTIGKNLHPNHNYVEIFFGSPIEGIFIEKLENGSLQVSAERISFLESQEKSAKGLYAILNPQADVKGNAPQVALIDPDRLKNAESPRLRNIRGIFNENSFTPEERQEALIQLAGLVRYINKMLKEGSY